jgi:hypothetical protein
MSGFDAKPLRAIPNQGSIAGISIAEISLFRAISIQANAADFSLEY